MKKFYLLLLAVICSVGLSWADNAGLVKATIRYVKDSGTPISVNEADNTSSTEELGNLSSLYIDGLWITNWTTNGGSISGTQLVYRTYSVSTTKESDKAYQKATTIGTYSGNDRQDSWSGTITLVDDNTASGEYYFKYYFESWYGGGTSNQYKPGLDNYNQLHYKVLPPAAQNLSVSGAISGTGTQTDPYVFIKGSNMTIGATQAHTDANSSLQVKFGDNAYSATNTMAVNANGNVTVLAKYHNGTADLDGTATAAKTVYYTIASYELSISAAGYSTFYDSQKAYIMPEGCEGYAFADGLVKEYDAEDVVPANVALVIKGTAGKKTLVFTTGGTAPANNSLLGTDEAEAITNDDAYYFYGLSLNSSNELSSVGFYWMNATGEAFTNGAHKAYLKLAKPAGAPQRYFVFGQTDTATAVEDVEAEEVVKFIENGQILIKKNGVIYNAMGQIVK